MNDDVNEKSKKKHKRHSGGLTYFSTVAVFVLIGVVIGAGVLYGISTPAVALVHKAESAMSMKVRDLEIGENQDYAELGKSTAGITYGTLVANVTCEKRGVNADAYYGLNRVSMRNGVGIKQGADGFFASSGTVIGGYDESYFSSLKYVKKGDIIKITAKDKTVSYKVTATALTEKGSKEISGSKNDLLLYSIYSDFSPESGKCFCVICEKTGEEAVTNE